MKTNKKDKYFDIPKNYQNFVLVQKTNAKPEDYGYTKEAVLKVGATDKPCGGEVLAH